MVALARHAREADPTCIEGTDHSRYRLLGVIGEGGSSLVYLARRDHDAKTVAIKRLHPEVTASGHRDRLIHEAEIVHNLQHEHVVKVLDIIRREDGDSFLVMEHLAGESVSQRVARKGALSLSETLDIGLQVASAVSAMHKLGVIHRDLKSENILLVAGKRGSLCAKLIDFGIAEHVVDGEPFVQEIVMGTPESMAPEQARGAALDHRCDIYSFGILLYEMVTGCGPFEGGDLPSVLDRVLGEAPVAPGHASGARYFIPEELDALVMRCLAKCPADRPPSMDEVCAELAAILSAQWTTERAIRLALGADDLEREDVECELDDLRAHHFSDEQTWAHHAARSGSEADDDSDAVDDSDAGRKEGDDETAGAGQASTDEEGVPAYDPDWTPEELEEAERLGSPSPNDSRRLARAAAVTLFVLIVAVGILGILDRELWSPLEAEILRR